jgi:hypothetical protein
MRGIPPQQSDNSLSKITHSIPQSTLQIDNMCDELSWLMQAGIFVHQLEQRQNQQEAVLPAAKNESSENVIAKIRARKEIARNQRDEVVEFAKRAAVCTRCGSSEVSKLMLLKGGCSHLLCTDCLSGIKTRKLLLPNGLTLAVCPVCKIGISPEAVEERPVHLIDFVERQSSRAAISAHTADDDIDFRAQVVADIHIASRVYWTRMRVLLCQQSEVLAASYANYQESEVALQKANNDLEFSQQMCDNAKLLLDETTRDYERSLKSFESREANVSGFPDMTINEAQTLNLDRFRSANDKFLALKKLQSATKQHGTLEQALQVTQEAQRKCHHLNNATRAAFEHCTKNMDVSYSTAFRQFEIIKMRLRETKSLLPDALGATGTEREMDEQFKHHTTIIRDLDDAKWHFQQNLVYPVDIPINIELTLKALEEDLRHEAQGSESLGNVAGTTEAQVGSLHAALKFEGLISPQRWESFPSKIVPDDCPTIQDAVKTLWRSCGRVIVRPGAFKEYVLLEGLVKICCEETISKACIYPLSGSLNTVIEVIGGFCVVSNVTIQSVGTVSDAPLVFCRSGCVQLESCVLKSENSVIVHTIGVKSSCHFDNCEFHGGQECNALVRLKISGVRGSRILGGSHLETGSPLTRKQLQGHKLHIRVSEFKCDGAVVHDDMNVYV